jgi:hypothetical protein
LNGAKGSRAQHPLGGDELGLEGGLFEVTARRAYTLKAINLYSV